MTVLQPGLYRILPTIPITDAQKSDLGLPLNIVPPPVYATAPKETGNNVSLQVAASGNERQVWKINLVDETNLLYTIDCADQNDASSEYPPTFGLKSDVADDAIVSCLSGQQNNSNQWKIIHHAPKPPFASYAKYIIHPAKGGSVQGDFYINGRRSAEGGRVWVNKQGTLQAHSWFFEPYVQPAITGSEGK